METCTTDSGASSLLRRSGRQWHCEVCDRRASGGAAKAKLARTECVGHPATALGEHARPQCHLLAQTGSFVWCCRCGARAAKFAKKLGEPCVGHPTSQEYARSIRLLSSGWHPKENRFLGTPKCSRHKHGQGGGKATKGTTATVLGWPSSSKQWIGSARQRRSHLTTMTRNTCS